MARYRKFPVTIWNEARFRELSDDAKLLYFFTFTHPAMTQLGAMRATKSGLAAEIGWGRTKFQRAFCQLVESNFIWNDDVAAFVCLPNFIDTNLPASPNAVKSWAKIYSLLPQCALRDELISKLQKLTESMGDAFAHAFRDGLPNA